MELSEAVVGTFILVKTVENDVEPPSLHWLKVIGKTSQGVYLTKESSSPMLFDFNGYTNCLGPDIEPRIIDVRKAN